ncbi:hypothetical protein Pelo_8035 [Pelomyxa schiedti]|nr:hypothetical protein Pelo_8035 [Pelomyxa schiedti]
MCATKLAVLLMDKRGARNPIARKVAVSIRRCPEEVMREIMNALVERKTAFPYLSFPSLGSFSKSVRCLFELEFARIHSLTLAFWKYFPVDAEAVKEAVFDQVSLNLQEFSRPSCAHQKLSHQIMLNTPKILGVALKGLPRFDKLGGWQVAGFNSILFLHRAYYESADPDSDDWKLITDELGELYCTLLDIIEPSAIGRIFQDFLANSLESEFLQNTNSHIMPIAEKFVAKGKRQISFEFTMKSERLMNEMGISRLASESWHKVGQAAKFSTDLNVAIFSLGSWTIPPSKFVLRLPQFLEDAWADFSEFFTRERGSSDLRRLNQGSATVLFTHPTEGFQREIFLSTIGMAALLAFNHVNSISLSGLASFCGASINDSEFTHEVHRLVYYQVLRREKSQSRDFEPDEKLEVGNMTRCSSSLFRKVAPRYCHSCGRELVRGHACYEETGVPAYYKCTIVKVLKLHTTDTPGTTPGVSLDALFEEVQTTTQFLTKQPLPRGLFDSTIAQLEGLGFLSTTGSIVHYKHT